MRFCGGYQNTKNNNEDFALTPYLFIVYANESNIKIYGIGICLFYSAIYIGIAFNVPKQIKLFRIHKPIKKNKSNEKP